MKRAAFAVPGSLETPTGGYAYDRRIIYELERLGWHIECVDVGEGFPWPTEATLSTAHARLLKVPAGQPIIIDGTMPQSSSVRPSDTPIANSAGCV